MEIVRREAVYLWYYFTVQFQMIFPYWLVGMGAGSLISVFGKNSIHRWFGILQHKRLGILGVVPASLLGIASPLCMYGTIPIAASFSQKGMKDDWLAAFMMSSILLNPQLAVYSAALGAEALAVRLILSALTGILAGLLVRRFYSRRDRPFFDFTGFEAQEGRDRDPNPLLRLLMNLLRNIRATGPYFLLGIALTACFQRYVPEDLVVRFFGNSKAFGVLMAAALGIPLYVCGGGTIPLLQEWLIRGMSLGSAAAFMITGPATKLTNLGALKIVLGAKHFAAYLLFITAVAFLSGVVVDWML